MIARLTLDPEGGLKVDMYQALHTTLTLDDALNLVEIDAVGQSWRAAARYNEDAINKMIRERKRADGR